MAGLSTTSVPLFLAVRSSLSWMAPAAGCAAMSIRAAACWRYYRTGLSTGTTKTRLPRASASPILQATSTACWSLIPGEPTPLAAAVNGSSPIALPLMNATVMDRMKPCSAVITVGIRDLISLILMMAVMTPLIRRASIAMRTCKTIQRVLSIQKASKWGWVVGLIKVGSNALDQVPLVLLPAAVQRATMYGVTTLE